MISFLLLFGYLILCYFLWHSQKDDPIGSISEILFILATGVLVLGIILIPLIRLGNITEVNSFKETKAEIQRAREQKRDLEKATITKETADKNAWLRNSKYFNSLPIIEWTVPDEVETLKPIKSKRG